MIALPTSVAVVQMVCGAPSTADRDLAAVLDRDPGAVVQLGGRRRGDDVVRADGDVLRGEQVADGLGARGDLGRPGRRRRG